MTNKLTRELRELDPHELERRLHEVEQDLMNVRFALATRQTENTARLTASKRQIARIKTIMTERQEEA